MSTRGPRREAGEGGVTSRVGMHTPELHLCPHLDDAERISSKRGTHVAEGVPWFRV